MLQPAKMELITAKWQLYMETGSLEAGNWKLETSSYFKSTTAYAPIFGSENSIAPSATT